MEAARHVLVARALDQALDVEEEILVGAVIEHGADRVERDAIEGDPERARVGGRQDASFGQHHEVGVVDRHERCQQQLLGVFKIFVEHVGDVLGRELHH